MANLLLILTAVATEEQYGKALGLSALAIVAPVCAARLLWWCCEYLVELIPAVTADTNR